MPDGSFCTDRSCVTPQASVLTEVCVIIKQRFVWDLLYFVCRHHVLELIAGAAFKTVIPTCTALEIQLFTTNTLLEIFVSILTYKSFEDAFTDEIAAHWIADIKEGMMNFINSMLLTTENQPHNDYRELLELALLFFGGASSQKIQFFKQYLQ